MKYLVILSSMVIVFSCQPKDSGTVPNNNVTPAQPTDEPSNTSIENHYESSWHTLNYKQKDSMAHELRLDSVEWLSARQFYDPDGNIPELLYINYDYIEDSKNLRYFPSILFDGSVETYSSYPRPDSLITLDSLIIDNLSGHWSELKKWRGQFYEFSGAGFGAFTITDSCLFRHNMDGNTIHYYESFSVVGDSIKLNFTSKESLVLFEENEDIVVVSFAGNCAYYQARTSKVHFPQITEICFSGGGIEWPYEEPEQCN